MTILSGVVTTYTGVAADVKPSTGITAGSKFTETDTSNSFTWNGTVWVLDTKSTYDYIIRVSPTSGYDAINCSTGVITNNAELGALVNNIIGSGNVSIFIKNSVTTQSTTIILKDFTRLTYEHGVKISLVNGFAGAAIEVDSSTRNCIVEGPYYGEAGTPQKLWTGLYINSTTGQIFNNVFRNCYFTACNIGLNLSTTAATGWINSCIFENFWIDVPNIGVQFTQTSTLVNNGTNNNIFRNVQGEAGAATTVGFKDISGTCNIFYDCGIYDLVAGSTSSNITAQGSYTVIMGGFLTSTWPTHGSDLGTGSFINDPTTPFYGTAHVFSTNLELDKPAISNIYNFAQVQAFKIANAGASTVDYFQAGTSVTANPATIAFSAIGSDANINAQFNPKGTGKIQLTDGTDLTKILAVDMSAVTTGTTLTVTAGANTASRTLNIPVLTGTDTICTLSATGQQTFNGGLRFFNSGTFGCVDIFNAGGAKAVTISNTGASTVNQIQLAGSVTGTPSTNKIQNIGNDSNINLLLSPKGTGRLQLSDGTDATKILALNLSSLTTGITLTLTSPTITANRILNLPLITTDGLIPIVFSARSVGATAAVASVLAYTVGANDASFRVSANILMTAFTAGTVSCTVAYTDESNTGRTLTLNFENIAGTISTTAGATGAFEGFVNQIRAKATTTITIATTVSTFTGTYNVEGMIEQVA